MPPSWALNRELNLRARRWERFDSVVGARHPTGYSEGSCRVRFAVWIRERQAVRHLQGLAVFQHDFCKDGKTAPSCAFQLELILARPNRAQWVGKRRVQPVGDFLDCVQILGIAFYPNRPGPPVIAFVKLVLGNSEVHITYVQDGSGANAPADNPNPTAASCSCKSRP